MQNEWLSTIGNMYWFFMLVFYPLTIREAYMDIARAKLVSFYTISLLFFLANAVIFIVLRLKKKPLPALNISSSEKKWLVALTILITISFIKNGNYSRTMFGIYDTGTAFLFLLTIIATYLLLRFQEINEIIFASCASVGVIIVGGIAVFQYLLVDIGGMYTKLNGFSADTFLSTMSNIDLAGFYFAIMFPFSVYLLTKGKWRFLGTAGILFAGLGIVISNTDTALIGFIFEVLIIFLISIKEAEYRKNAFIAGIILGCSLFIIMLLRMTIGATREIDFIQRMVSSPVVVVLVLAASIVGLKSSNNEKAMKVFRGSIISALILLCLYPITIILYTKFAHPTADSPIRNVLFFDYLWGSNRGYIWRVNLDLFKEGSILDKLLGNGVESFGTMYQAKAEYFRDKYISLYEDKYLSDSHNTYLHVMFEYGILSLIAALGFIFTRAKNLITNENYFMKLKAVALIGALIIGIFIMSYNINMAFWTILL